MAHTVLLSIGSNTYAKRNLRKAQRLLAAEFPHIAFTKLMASKPFGKHYKRDFLNVLAVFESDHSLQQINGTLKALEKVMGRLPEDKFKGRVVIDIDLLKYDDIMFKPNDWQRDYVKNLLPFVEG